MERLQRLLRLAKIRGDRLAIAVLETRIASKKIKPVDEWAMLFMGWTEAEMRLAWGDR